MQAKILKIEFDDGNYLFFFNKNKKQNPTISRSTKASSEE
jgi:hypothetical protein